MQLVVLNENAKTILKIHIEYIIYMLIWAFLEWSKR